jgi:hypothetical protein
MITLQKKKKKNGAISDGHLKQRTNPVFFHMMREKLIHNMIGLFSTNCSVFLSHLLNSCIQINSSSLLYIVGLLFWDSNLK